MPKPISVLALSIILATSVAVPLAMAGEADHEPDDTHEHGAAFFGEAKDIKGMAPLANVRVKAQLRGTMRFFITQTDDDGRFKRSGMGTDVDPENVDITCEKTGYKTLDVSKRRMSSAKDATVEIECLLEKAG